ncbi:MAG: hypothetical protein IPJ40_23860 [Saprospirales bacterium]|nr:hypothetical protein [Saprospirales bacterium]
MKTFLFLFLFAPLFVLAQWAPFSSIDGRFQIPSPKPLAHQESTVETPMGVIIYHTYFHQPEKDPNGNQWFSVSYCDYPDGTIHSDSTDLLEEFFEETIKESASSVNGEVRYVEHIDYNTLPGRFWRVDYLNGQVVIKSKAYLIANRFYVIQVVILKDKSANSDAARFLDGFKLLVG